MKGMFFGTIPCLRGVVEMLFEDKKIEFVKLFKYFGIMLADPLKFKDHIDYLIKKVTPELKTIGKMRNYVGRGTALLLHQF